MNFTRQSSVTRIIAGLVFVVMAVAGWMLGSGGGESRETAPESMDQQSRIPTRPLRHGPAGGQKVRALTHAVMSAGDTSDRMRATISLVNTLPLSELTAWLNERRFESREGFELTLFSKLAKERWRNEDPEGFLRWSTREGDRSASVIFSQWAESDPQRLLSFFKESPEVGGELNALGQIAKHDPSLALGRYREMLANAELGDGNDYLARQFLGELAASSPEALEAALDSLPDNQRSLAESALVGERLKSDFDGEIRELWARPDGWKLFEEGLSTESENDIGSQMLANLDEMPDSWKAKLADRSYRFISDENATDWLALDFEAYGFSESQAKQTQTYAIQVVSRKDPARALQSLEGPGADDRFRKSIISSLFSRHANDSNKTEELMALLNTEADREVANAMIESRQQSNLEESSAQERIETPSQWIEQAQNVDLDSGNAYQMEAQLRNWSKEKFDELAVEFQSMPDENKQVVARILSGVGSNTVIDPELKGEAIRYLVANPPDEEGGAQRQSQSASAMTSQHVVQWGMKDPIAASEWTRSLPAGDARLWAQKNLAANWAQYDPDAASQWVGTLPAAERKEVKSFMSKGEK
jgi:hypothetical protein